MMFRGVMIGLVAVLLCMRVLAQEDAVIFVYTMFNDETNTPSLCWFDVSAPDDENCMTTPDISQSALSPDGGFVAIREANGHLSLVDLSLVDLAAQIVHDFELCQPFQEFLWDQHYLQSATLIWSPDGRSLAFTGIEADTECDIENRADVYIYDVQARILQNITQDTTVIRSLVIPVSWSPDSEWLILRGAWTESLNQYDFISPDFGVAIINRDGSGFRRISPNHNACRLIWSPDMRWLASDTQCFEYPGDGSALILLPFDPIPIDGDGRMLDEVVAPLRFDWRGDSFWTSYYTPPVWINETTLVTYRRLYPFTLGYLNDERTAHYSSNGLVAIDTETYSETALDIPEFTGTDNVQLLEGWFVAEDRTLERVIYSAYNPVLDRLFTITSDIPLCPIGYALRIEQQGDYAGVLDACRSATAEVSLYVYDTSDFSVVRRIFNPNGYSILPLGFAHTGN